MKTIQVLVKRKGKRNLKQTATACLNYLSVSNTAFVRPNVKHKIRCLSIDSLSKLELDL